MILLLPYLNGLVGGGVDGRSVQGLQCDSFGSYVNIYLRYRIIILLSYILPTLLCLT